MRCRVVPVGEGCRVVLGDAVAVAVEEAEAVQTLTWPLSAAFWYHSMPRGSSASDAEPLLVEGSYAVHRVNVAEIGAEAEKLGAAEIVLGKPSPLRYREPEHVVGLSGALLGQLVEEINCLAHVLRHVGAPDVHLGENALGPEAPSRRLPARSNT